MKFTEFGLDDGLMDGIDSMGYDEATPVQEQVIPKILDGHDIIAAAQTGTGKTAAFLVPLIQNILWNTTDDHQVNSMVIVPTRELATQIVQVIEGISYYTSISCIAVYGGGDGTVFNAEKKALSQGADIVVCTPGRLISHLNMGYVNIAKLKYLVLDEADRMLDMGFYEDLMKIIDKMPKERQNMLFSATMPPAIRKLANGILKNPVEINIAISKPPEQIKQEAFLVFEEQKIPLIKNILTQRDFNSVVVFCSSKMSVKKLTAELRRAKISSNEIHSDLEQDKREQVMMDFRSKRLKVLVATDIAARGIDIDQLSHVINFDLPEVPETYVHRIGRTGRAGLEGVAYSFCDEEEKDNLKGIEKLIGMKIPVIEKHPYPASDSGLVKINLPKSKDVVKRPDAVHTNQQAKKKQFTKKAYKKW